MFTAETVSKRKKNEIEMRNRCSVSYTFTSNQNNIPYANTSYYILRTTIIIILLSSHPSSLNGAGSLNKRNPIRGLRGGKDYQQMVRIAAKCTPFSSFGGYDDGDDDEDDAHG